MNEQKKPLSQREYAKELFRTLSNKLGMGSIPLHRFDLPEDSPIKKRCMADLRAGNLDAISLTRLNAVCEHFNIPKPKFLNNL